MNQNFQARIGVVGTDEIRDKVALLKKQEEKKKLEEQEKNAKIFSNQMALRTKSQISKVMVLWI